METAVNIIREVTKKTSDKLCGIGKKEILFTSGYTSTIINEITTLESKWESNPFPLIAMFTELVTEHIFGKEISFTIPKIVICCRAVDNLTERQRIDTSFKTTLYPIFNEFQNQLEKIHIGYDVPMVRSDVPYYTETGNNSGKFNEMVDGIIIKNLKIKTIINNC